MDASKLLGRLAATNSLTPKEWLQLLAAQDELLPQAQGLAREIATANFGKAIFYRGIVEFTNYCRNDCLYCGIRKSNQTLTRYRLSQEVIIECCDKGAAQGVQTFVLQGGEDLNITDAWLSDLIQKLTTSFPKACITLSLGERSPASYAQLFQAGARRYLLRHETASPAHYSKLHPARQAFWHRITCLYTLKALGYQTGCGMMIGSPYQTLDDLALDFSFIQEFQPAMLGIGPFLPHHATPFKNAAKGLAAQTLYVLALSRILLPPLLLPATTALNTLLPTGYAQGVLSGCNVIMPNLTITPHKQDYQLYDHKPVAEDIAKTLAAISQELAPIGYYLQSARGDFNPLGAKKSCT
ncbi:MAG: [Desulfovibrionaceae bacterium]|nr:[FeFe] hydrogenase H-cluster radical SAM maturase HydE [Desulfovibrionaceae bacterium]